jgi:NADH dehydrogenase
LKVFRRKLWSRKTNGYRSTNGTENIYAIGDTCIQLTDGFPNGHPQVAQVAIQQGLNLAKKFQVNTKRKP